MPTHPSPERQDNLNPLQAPPVVRPPQPDSGDKDERTSAGEVTSPDSLVTPDMEEPAETNRPPLGN